MKTLLLALFVFTFSTNLISQNSNEVVIEYSFDDFGSEGAGAFATYRDGKLIAVDAGLYASTFQITIKYTFEPEAINVTEQKFIYPNGIENANSEGGMKLNYTYNYIIDYDGEFILTDPSYEITDIWDLIKETIPLEISE